MKINQPPQHERPEEEPVDRPVLQEELADQPRSTRAAVAASYWFWPWTQTQDWKWKSLWRTSCHFLRLGKPKRWKRTRMIPHPPSPSETIRHENRLQRLNWLYPSVHLLAFVTADIFNFKIRDRCYHMNSSVQVKCPIKPCQREREYTCTSLQGTEMKAASCDKSLLWLQDAKPLWRWLWWLNKKKRI